MSFLPRSPTPPKGLPTSPLPWKTFYLECLAPAFNELSSSGVRPFPDSSKKEVFQCCGSCSHEELGRLTTDGQAYVFFHSQSISEDALHELMEPRRVYALNEDGEIDYDAELIDDGEFEATLEDYAALNYRDEGDPCLYLGHGGFKWTEPKRKNEQGKDVFEMPADAKLAVSILSKYMKVEWDEDGHRTLPGYNICVKPFTVGEWDKIFYPNLTLKLCLDAMWRLRCDKTVVARTTLPTSPTLSTPVDEAWVSGIFLRTSEKGGAEGKVLSLPAAVAEVILSFVRT